MKMMNFLVDILPKKSSRVLTLFLFLQSGVIPVSAQSQKRPFEFEYNDLVYRGSIEMPLRRAHGLVILVPGHGPTDFIKGAEYKELRNFFTDLGFSVCFWDKAGCGKSEGVYDHNQSIQSSAEETIAAITKLKSLNVSGSHMLGLWGISRAGWICPLVIEKIPSIQFWISVSGTDQFENSRYMLEANLKVEGRKASDISVIMSEWDHYQKVLVNGGESLEEFLAAIPNLMSDPYFNGNNFQFTQESFEGIQHAYQNSGLTFDDSTNLAIMVDEFDSKLNSMDIPVLAIFGEKDSQVDWRSTRNLYRRTIGQNQNAKLTIKTFPNGNHTINKCETGGINENLEKFGNTKCEGYYDTMRLWLEKLR